MSDNIVPPTLSEIIELGAVDHNIFCLGFFPSTFRNLSPLYADRLWQNLESNDAKLLNAQIYRGGAKTTHLRAFMAKRVSYGISRTILLISKSAGHSERSLAWIKRKIEMKDAWATAFGLEQGKLWRNDQIEIIHKGLGLSIFIMGLGITGPIRGINFEDWRPDLIVIDDAISDESAATPEQREKTEDLILGALVNSLAPEVDSPGSKLVMLQTPFSHEDASMKALLDPAWTSVRQGCWTRETEDMPIEYQESCWPERFPSEKLRRMKLGAMARNKLSLFTREMEVKLITPENSDFRVEWLEYYKVAEVTPQFKHGLKVVIAIDPVPPPSEREIAKGMKGKDYECIAVCGYKEGRFYLLDYEFNRGHNPNWTLSTLFTLIYKWRPARIRVESINYQRTLAWIIRNKMRELGRYVPIEEVTDKRQKQLRIKDSLEGIASNQALFVDRDRHTHFITQFIEFPNSQYDDIIDAVSIALDGLHSSEALSEDAYEEDMDYKSLTLKRGAP